MSPVERSSQISQIFVKLNKIRQIMFFSLNAPIAWSLFVMGTLYFKGTSLTKLLVLL